MYTIGQISEMFHLPISTLRYYDKEGLFPGLTRRSGVRLFGPAEIEALNIIECLKSSGLGIAQIREYFALCAGGSSTYADRKALFAARKQAVEQEIASLQKTLDMLTYKCWYYDTAMADGSEKRIHAMLPDKLPPEIQRCYDNGRT